ncbi:MAG: DUF4838 domain-containing protein [Candidatus Methanomethylophilaceae archaeon]|nr:DUF4838 domain-containing protein [Candidatus Methanomethylophilaceae archaeon]
MRIFLSVLLSLLLLLPLLVSCGESPANVPGASSDAEGTPGTEPATEPVSEPETDPFEDGDPLPVDLTVPECLKTKDGAILGTIILPKAAADDAILQNAAQDLQYHLKLVLGSDFPIVSRTGEGYGSLIIATPDSLPAVSEMFADDLAWLSDLGSKETGKWGSDGFAIRQAGDDIYILGNTSKGAMNGVYDLIEDNLGVLWYRADESRGLVYDELEEAVVEKVDYREKSPISVRGFLGGNDRACAMLIARNKCNTSGGHKDLGFIEYHGGLSYDIISSLVNSPLYDPNETEYWETDDEGNSLGQAGSQQVNPWSDKAAEALAARAIQQIQNSGIKFFFIAEVDMGRPQRCVPYDTEPYEYAPGQFVYPEDENYYSTVYHSMINKVARIVKEEVPDGIIGTYAYRIAFIPPACDMEDNVRIIFAPVGEDYTCPILDPSIQDRVKSPAAIHNWEYLPLWCQKAQYVALYHYYICNGYGTEYGWPIWYRIQEDLKGYVQLGIDGVATDGLTDVDQRGGWLSYTGASGIDSNYWDMNHLLCWLYAKLLWNPYEDIPSLITYFCDKVYGDASPYMQEYYRLMEQGFAGGTATYKGATTLDTHSSTYYKVFIYKQNIGHELLDELEKAYNAATGPVKETIKYIWDRVKFNLSNFRSF